MGNLVVSYTPMISKAMVNSAIMSLFLIENSMILLSMFFTVNQINNGATSLLEIA